MQPPHQNVRINLAELKAEIVKKLGPDRSKQYFYYFNKFLSLRVSKGEFDRLCFRIIGRENIPLHNKFIRSILRNASTQKSPPPSSQKDDILKQVTQVGGKDFTADGYENGLHIGIAHAAGSPGLSNGGDMLPVSPRKSRSSNRDRRAGERGSVLGPNGTAGFAPQLTSVQSNKFNVMFEHGGLDSLQIGRQVHQHHQGILQQPDNLNEIFLPQPAKKSVVMRPSDSSSHIYGKDHAKMVVRDDDGKQVSSRIQLQAPLGVPFCPVSIGGTCRYLPQSSSHRCIGTCNDGALLDSLTLRERMEQIAVGQGLEGVSVDCANMMNHGLDSYLKGLIMSCIELVGSRSGHELRRNNTDKLHTLGNFINGIRPGHQYQMLSSGQPLEVQEQRIQCPISLQDFKVAMDLNPQQLGEDWPLLLEKICTSAFDK